MKLLGVDIGGTFTDVYFVDNETGEQRIHKVSTTPDDPSEGALTGIRELCAMTDTDPGEIDYVLHGTTIATNTVLEYDGVETGMITTENYRDITHIGRHQRPQNYSIQQSVPWQDRPLVERRYKKTVPERIAADGSVERELEESAVADAAAEFREAGVDSIAIAFLFSYLNDAHERRAKEIVEEVHPDAYVTTSNEVYPQFREFERFTTTAMNAFVGPPVIEYAARFERQLADLGVDADLHVMQSNGGIATEEMVRQTPVSLLLSGPAAGILGAKWRSDATVPDDEATDVITLDMGGTSADIGIVADDEIVEANVRETEIGGYPVMIPMIDIETIGAGGGSVAYVDPGGAFRVGPESAGAVPGPVAYDRGGEEPTVTDAHVTLGRIRDEFFLGGELGLETAAPREAIESALADPLGIDPIEASLGVLEIVNTNMANAIRSKTVQKGRDPGQFTLVAFGGAGPLHAASIARELDIPRTLVPSNPGVLSAVGLSTTDLQYDRITTEFSLLEAVDRDALREEYAGLTAAVTDQLRDADVDGDRIEVELSADCRYEGQGYELSVPIGTDESVPDLEAIRETFDAMHEAEFGHNFPDNAVELVNLRATARGRLPSSERVPIGDPDAAIDDLAVDTRDVYFGGDGEPTAYATPFVERRALGAGQELAGPAIIAETDSTILVPPDFTARVLEYGDIELRNDAVHQ
ncbi:hydantoinase/oxoprolinase family protein [Natrinema versiforme]|uniref:5-oxoprolinase n=1 Tax=Natrinema versiforme JCM 10478 TaxID=1227496 RepID=L9XY76_9EURY|nr:hydantoinase/oxoprolinase family protein [Natrinema versiforme]ELY65523.1 5-oxoprolinase [Natrinema versiforme JCM 10478]